MSDSGDLRQPPRAQRCREHSASGWAWSLRNCLRSPIVTSSPVPSSSGDTAHGRHRRERTSACGPTRGGHRPRGARARRDHRQCCGGTDRIAFPCGTGRRQRAGRVVASVRSVRFTTTPRALATAGLASGFIGTTTGVGGPPMAFVYRHAEGDPIHVVGVLHRGLADVGRGTHGDRLTRHEAVATRRVARSRCTRGSRGGAGVDGPIAHGTCPPTHPRCAQRPRSRCSPKNFVRFATILDRRRSIKHTA